MRDDVLVCDMDKTLITVNSFPIFVADLLRQIVRRRQVHDGVELCTALIQRKLFGGKHTNFKRTVTLIADRQQPVWLKSWSERMYTSFANPAVRAILHDWDGPVILSTAAPLAYAREIGLLASIHTVDASHFENNSWIDNYGVRKLESLRRQGIGSFVVVTDDVQADFPLVEAALKVILVTGSGVVRLRR